MNEEERYLFDLTGYLLVDKVLSSGELGELNSLIDSYDLWEEHGTCRLGNGVNRPSPNKLSFGPLHRCEEPIRKLINHPKLMPYLLELIGPKFRYDHGYAIVMKEGGEKLRLHGGGTPYDPGQYYHFRNGRFYNGLIVVSYALADIGPGEGGFAAVPGSHKSNIPCPISYKNFERSGSWLLQVPQKAGSAVIFTEALTHGTWPWTATSERRSLLYKYSPGHMSYAKTYPTADDVPTSESSPEMRRILEPPYIGGRPEVVDKG